MRLRTHLRIDTELCGEVVELDNGRAVVELATTQKMAADERGLVHGGFTFGAADYAAMAAVNDPNVVLAAADVRFLAPVVVGDLVRFEARFKESEGKKALVEVKGSVEGREVFAGRFRTYTPDRHILGH
jgi:acyl-coenzyme A thioesterase PaaI-like protein